MRADGAQVIRIGADFPIDQPIIASHINATERFVWRPELMIVKQRIAKVMHQER